MIGRPRPARRALLALLIGVVACFSGVKYVGDGEPCISGDQVFEASVECHETLTCLPIALYPGGRRKGTCAPVCDSQRPCAADLVCAAGACVRPCSAACAGGIFDYSAVCCRLPQQGVSACLPAVACDLASGARDADSDMTSEDAGAGQ